MLSRLGQVNHYYVDAYYGDQVIVDFLSPDVSGERRFAVLKRPNASARGTKLLSSSTL